MMIRNRSVLLSTLATVAGLAGLAGCESTPPATQKPAAVETRSPLAGTPPATASTPATPATPSATTPQSRVATVDLAAQNAAVSSKAAATAAVASAQRVVYFDFDSFVIKDEYKPTIDVFAKALAADKARKLTVEGNTDDRGGREYNLALGQKRAEAVVKSLALLGASEQQVEAVSFGAERPADPAHNEAAWAKNRRAELKDR